MKWYNQNLNRCSAKKISKDKIFLTLKWLESESESGAEVNDDWSSRCDSGVEECSSGEYASPAVVCLEFVHPSGRGYAPDVGGGYGDVGDSLIGPGVPGGSGEEHLKRSQAGQDRHF